MSLTQPRRRCSAGSMTTRAARNWPAIGGFLCGLGGVVGYFTLVLIHNPRLRWLIHTPVLNLVLVAAGLCLSLLGVIQAFQGKRGGKFSAPALAALNLALSGFLGWHLFVASYRLPPAMRAPTVGAVAPDFELKDERGVPVRLSSFRGRSVVLLFYRGFW
jgi:hypothetical protein